MLDKTREIQGLWLRQDGDYIYCPDNDNVVIYNFVFTDLAEMGNFVVWIPRLDQLQAMLVLQYPECVNLDYVTTLFKKFLEKPIDSYGWTWEKLWLCLVMQEEYNKTWNGKDWVTNGK